MSVKKSKISQLGVVVTTLLGLAAHSPFTTANAQHLNTKAVWIDGQNLVSPFMRVYGNSLPPIGHVRFCQNHPSECQRKGHVINDRFQLTPERWKQLKNVNSQINNLIEPVTDQDLYGRLEHWTFPNNYMGDCEDYVLLKRQRLIELGWPENALLITVVLDEKNEGHAILTARTAQGDFLLDNKLQNVVGWNQVPYRFIKRQSYRNPRHWVSLLPQERRQRISSASSDR